jgi:hypothetical protein
LGAAEGFNEAPEDLGDDGGEELPREAALTRPGAMCFSGVFSGESKTPPVHGEFVVFP